MRIYYQNNQDIKKFFNNSLIYLYHDYSQSILVYAHGTTHNIPKIFCGPFTSILVPAPRNIDDPTSLSKHYTRAFCLVLEKKKNADGKHTHGIRSRSICSSCTSSASFLVRAHFGLCTHNTGRGPLMTVSLVTSVTRQFYN